MSFQEKIDALQQIEDLVGLERFVLSDRGSHGGREELGEAVGM